MTWHEFCAHLILMAEEAEDGRERRGGGEVALIDPETGLPQGEGWGKLPPNHVLEQLPSWPADPELN